MRHNAARQSAAPALPPDHSFGENAYMPIDLLFRAATALPAGIANLRRLYWLRWLSIAGQLAAVAAAVWLLEISLPLPETFIPIGLLVLFNVYTAARLNNKREPSAHEYVVHLAADMLALGALLYFTGGATNPFVFLFLLPLTVAATLL